MKKCFSAAKSFMAIMATVSLMMCNTSCNDDDYVSDSAKSKTTLTSNKAGQDLTFGNSLVIVRADQLDQQRIELNTTEPVQVKSRDGNVTFECVQENGKYYLKPQLLKDFEGETMVDMATVSAPGQSGKDIYISVRPGSNASASDASDASDGIGRMLQESVGATADATTDATELEKKAKLNRYKEVFSYGIQPWVMAGMAGQKTDVSEPIFDGDILMSKGYISLVGNSSEGTSTIKVEGSSLQEVTTKLSVKAGISGVLPCFPTAALGFDFASNHEATSSNYYEYFTVSRNTTQAQGALRTSKMSAEDIATCIDTTLNKYLNQDLATDEFPMNLDGTKKLLSHYGTHYTTYCILGSQCRVDFRKKQDITTNSTSIEAAFAMKAAVDKQELSHLTGTKDNSLADRVKVYNMMGEDDPKGNLSVGVSWKTHCEQTEMETEVYTFGGEFGETTNVDNPTGWKPSTDPNRWIPISFLKPTAEKNDPSLIPITELCLDKNGKRYQYINDILNDSTLLKEYYAWAGKDFSEKGDNAEWVIAGIQVKVGDNEDEYAPYKAVCPDGEERIFYPMAYRDGTCSSLSNWSNKCADTELYAFGAIGRHRSHVWYYALAMKDDCPGIAEIKIQENRPGAGWINEMNPTTTTFSTGWDAFVEDYRLWVKPISKEEAKNNSVKPISAVALVNEENIILSTTGGSEYGYTAESCNRYEKIWSENAGNITKLGKSEISKYGIYDMWVVSQPNYLFLWYSKSPITLTTDQDKIGISHPTNMKKGAL